MKRRDFIAKLTAAGIGAAALGGAAGAAAQGGNRARLMHRPYGNSGRSLSIIGLGGIVVNGVPQSEANDTVAWAVDHGVNYFDVAPTYGNAQERLGPALEPYREATFLACKTEKRDAEGAQAALEESLRLLRTDHVDLYQLHGLTKVEEVDRVFAPGGAMEVFLRAREQGKARHLGFSAHSPEAALKALDRFPFDSVLFPFNSVCVENGNFGPQVLDKAQEKGAACLALKSLAWTPWAQGAERNYPKCWYQPQDDPAVAALMLRYTLSLPVVAAVPPGDGRLFKLAVEAMLNYTPLTGPERATLIARLRGVEPIFRVG